jgi:hypothetical protein
MAVPIPKTWDYEEHPTSTEFNTEIRDYLNFLLSPPRCSLYKISAQNIAASTYVPIAFAGENFDTDSMHVTSSPDYTKITINTPGIYLLCGRISYGTEFTGGISHA